MKTTSHIISVLSCCFAGNGSLRAGMVAGWIVFLACCMGCTGTGRLKEGERLYTGAKIKITKADKEWSTKILKADLKKAATIPRPNKKIIWMRPKLVIYNMFQNSRPKSFGNFIATRLGEPPVLYEPKIANRHRELLIERAANDGYFKTKISSTEKVHKHTVKLQHEAFVQSPRETMDDVVYPDDDSTVLGRTLWALRPKSLVQPGQPYHLEEFIAERQRLADSLRNHGWYYFSPDHLLFEADTLHPRGEVNVTLRIKKEVGERERRRYRVSNVFVYPDYDLARQQDSARTTDTLRFECISYIYHQLLTKPEILNKQIFLRCGEYYSNNDYQATIYRLLNLNLYKFINIRFDVSPEADTLLIARIYLTPYRPERIEATLSGVFSPGFYAGFRMGTAYNHRNTFRGAEALRLSLDGAYLRTNKDNFDFRDFIVSDASARLTLPRFLFLPLKQRLAFGTTQFKLRHETNWFKYDLPELGPFRLSFQRIQGEAGYLWKKNRRGSVVQEINPVSVGLQYSTINKQAVRQKLIAAIPSDTTGTSLSLLTFVEYKPNYTFTLDQRLEPARRFTQYFRQRFALQASGYTGNRYLPSEYELNSPFNFFVESDYRQYQKTHGRNVLAFRFAIGAGIPLRPNGTIALLDRFVIGGASSVRAFAPRTVGPGSEPSKTDNTGLTVGSYTGNMLIETSLEYRMPIGKYPELAFFVDAGNVWLTSGADATDASNFLLSRFYRELALGTGMGVRVNLGFFVLRLDLAFPLSKPYLPVRKRWVADDLHFGSGVWRRQNLNWNFSFGYPF